MKAMILAAGLGTRLGAATRGLPKAMLDVNGHPLLEYIVAALAQHGFNDLVINLHHRGDLIREYFGDGSRWRVRISYSEERELLGTAGAVKNVRSFFGGEDFLVHYGDVVTDQDLTAMMQYHRTHDGFGTLLVHQRHGSNSVLTLDEHHRITSFLERPAGTLKTSPTTWVHSGVSILRTPVLDLIPANSNCDLPRDVYAPAIARGESFFGWPLRGYRCAVDSPERLEELRTAVRDGRLAIRLP
ncbi:MAG: NDP-sugar synthase [Thermoanaerobaculia bacterium]